MQDPTQTIKMHTPQSQQQLLGQDTGKKGKRKRKKQTTRKKTTKKDFGSGTSGSEHEPSDNEQRQYAVMPQLIAAAPGNINIPQANAIILGSTITHEHNQARDHWRQFDESGKFHPNRDFGVWLLPIDALMNRQGINPTERQEMIIEWLSKKEIRNEMRLISNTTVGYPNFVQACRVRWRSETGLLLNRQKMNNYKWRDDLTFKQNVNYFNQLYIEYQAQAYVE